MTVDVQRAVALAAEAKAHSDPGRRHGLPPRRPRLWSRASRWPTRCRATAWWEAEGHGGRIAAVLVDAACSLASLAADAGLFDLARWGLEQARLVEPYSEALSRSAMELAAAEGDADRLRLEWRECQRRVDALDPGSSPSARTESLYGELSRRVLVGAAGPVALGRATRLRQRLNAGRRSVPPHDVLEPGHPAALDEHGVAGPSARSSATASSALVTCGRAVEPRLVPHHLDPERRGQPGDRGGARPRSPPRARP